MVMKEAADIFSKLEELCRKLDDANFSTFFICFFFLIFWTKFWQSEFIRCLDMDLQIWFKLSDPRIPSNFKTKLDNGIIYQFT